MSSTRLSYDELVYLCVSLAQAKEVYGLTEKSDETRVDWKEVRQGLIDNKFLMRDTISDSDALLVNPRLALMIEAISWPKLFISVSKPADLPKEHCFYFTRHFAVQMSKAENKSDQYLLSWYNDSHTVRFALDTIIGWNKTPIRNSFPYAAEFTLDEYEAYLKTIREQDHQGHISMLKYKDGNDYREFPPDAAQDVFETLITKKLWFSMVILTFDAKSTDSKRIVEQTIIYEGSNGLWCMEITKEGARLFCADEKKMKSKFEIISSLFRYL